MVSRVSMVAVAAVTVFTFAGTARAGDPYLFLPAAVERALSQAPQMRAAGAEVDARAGALKQAGAWPNPALELRGDDGLGQEDDQGGSDLREVAITQPVPLTRLRHQRREAQAQLQAAEAARHYERLRLESVVAHAYHELQFASAWLEMAADRLRVTEELFARDRSDRVVRYLSPFEATRARAALESARQEYANARDQYNEALTGLRLLLVLSPEDSLQLPEIQPPPAPPALADLVRRLDAHPAIEAAARDIEATRAAVDVARARRFADPQLKLYRERDFINGARRDVTGVAVGVELPLWTRNAGAIAMAWADADRSQAQLEARRRELQTQLHESRLHLGNLIEQAEGYRRGVLMESNQALTLARRGFRAGEVNLLAVIDASDAYFEAYERYVVLLRDAWREMTNLRLAAGLSVLDSPEAAL